MQDDYLQYGIDWTGTVPSDEENTVVVPELPPILSDDDAVALQCLINSVVEASPEDTWKSQYIIARTFVGSITIVSSSIYAILEHVK